MSTLSKSMEEITYRRAGEVVTHSTRGEAHEMVDKQKRYRQILEVFAVRPELTAKEVAVWLWKRGDVPTPDRNYSAPRITELCQEGVLEPVGKKKCQYTGRTVAVFAVRKVG